MRIFILMILIAPAVGCSSGLTEKRVEQDFRGLIKANYKVITIEKVHRVSFGDGWDDGAEVRVYFVAKCETGGAADAQGAECWDGEMHMQMSYQKNSSGSWELLSSRVLAAE
ncbi:hypothetical protein [Lysobacter sp. Root604]|uniref:hypothetical protein n=1 Tax=Lysobacter sp. Root604 TaxID=1736568 RepID=UPI0012FAFB98|nr:hypothetical protein [Lysobacter sp. Root604]